MGSSRRSQVVGRRFLFDIQMGLGQSLDEICAIRASGKTAWSGSITDNGQVRISAPNLFGGDKGEGGLDGTLDVMFGAEDQVPVPKLVSMLGGIVPGFRGITTAFYSGLITSNNPYPKAWEILRRGGNRLWDAEGAWYPTKQFIWLADNQIKAMNPIHMLFLLYTGRRFRGLPRTFMNDVGWRAAADTIYAEQLGLCFEWKRSDTFKSFRDTVLAHISAEVYVDRSTGLIDIRLLRDDYDVNSLPLFDEDSGLLDIIQDEASAGDADSVPSQLIGKYEDAITGETRKVRAVNSAVAQRDGGRSSEEVDYLGAPTAEIAGRLVARDLRIRTSALKRFKVVLDRRGRKLSPGQPFRLRSRKRGIETIVVRAGRIEDGTLNDGRITITALQDVFSLPATNYIPTPPIGWLPPDRTPQAVTIRRLFELPYRELAGVIDPANLKLLDVTACYLAALAQAPTSMSLSYNLTDRVGASGAFTDRNAHDWCPTGVIATAIAKGNAPVVVTVTSASRFEDVAIGKAAVIDDEILRVDAINYVTGAVTLARACADTVPATHATGTRIWFYDGFEGFDETVYSQGLSINAQLLTNTSQGQLDPVLAATDALALQGRQGRPYPPAAFTIGGQAFPGSITGDVVVAWAHRNRLQQADQLIDTSFGSIGPEAGTTYSAQLARVDTGAVLASSTGITGAGVTLTSTYDGPVTLEVWALRDGIQSLQRQRHSFSLYQPLAAPTGLQATYVNSTVGARLSWSQAGSGVAARVYRSLAPISSGALPAPLVELPAGVTTYDDSSVLTNQTYYYRVEAVRAGSTALSSEISVLTGAVDRGFTVPGVRTQSTGTSITVPTGAAAGDLLILVLTNGATGSKSLPTGFTLLSSSAAGAIGYRVMQSGDSSFTLAASSYATMVAVRCTAGTPTIDVYAESSLYTTQPVTITTPSVTAGLSGEAAFMIFISANGAMSQAPGYTNLISYNVNGQGGCGMAMSWTVLPGTGAFAGTSCTTSAQVTFPARAATLLLK